MHLVCMPGTKTSSVPWTIGTKGGGAVSQNKVECINCLPEGLAWLQRTPGTPGGLGMDGTNNFWGDFKRFRKQLWARQVLALNRKPLDGGVALLRPPRSPWDGDPLESDRLTSAQQFPGWYRDRFLDKTASRGGQVCAFPASHNTGGGSTAAHTHAHVVVLSATLPGGEGPAGGRGLRGPERGGGVDRRPAQEGRGLGRGGGPGAAEGRGASQGLQAKAGHLVQPLRQNQKIKL